MTQDGTPDVGLRHAQLLSVMTICGAATLGELAAVTLLRPGYVRVMLDELVSWRLASLTIHGESTASEWWPAGPQVEAAVQHMADAGEEGWLGEALAAADLLGWISESRRLEVTLDTLGIPDHLRDRCQMVAVR